MNQPAASFAMHTTKVHTISQREMRPRIKVGLGMTVFSVVESVVEGDLSCGQ